MKTTKFKDLRTTKKGEYGEYLIQNLLQNLGEIVYRPATEDKAHLFDMLSIKKDGTVYAVDVKTKAHRNYQDTGINYKHYLQYCEFAETYKMEFILLFVDEETESIYGNSLRHLKTKKCTMWKEFIYWNLSDMFTIKTLTKEEVLKIKEFNNENLY